MCRSSQPNLRRSAEDDELPPANFIDGRHAFKSSRRLRFPQYLSGFYVEGAHLTIPRSRENQSPGRNHGTHLRIMGASVLDAIRGKLRHLSEGDLPFDGPLIQIVGSEGSPWRCDRRKAVARNHKAEPATIADLTCIRRCLRLELEQAGQILRHHDESTLRRIHRGATPV